MAHHFIGIGGIGMSSLARIVLQKGGQVQGCDQKPTALLQKLQEEGAKLYLENNSQEIPPSSTVVYSTAVLSDHPDCQKARLMNLPLIHRSDFLSQLMEGYKGVVVAGTHGKTTVSSLLSAILVRAGKDPCFSVGGMIKELKTNGRYGKGTYFIAEGDESDGSFVKHPAFAAILTNLDKEHMDFWEKEERLYEAFSQFAKDKELLFWCGDDPGLCQLDLKGISYGFSEGCDLQIKEARQKKEKSEFSLTFQGKRYEGIELSLLGRHNILNAASVFGMALLLGVEEEKIRSGLSLFEGVSRRMEAIGEERGVIFYDDYAHHPVEVKAVLQALRQKVRERRVVAVFQPHRYSRFSLFFDDFLASFSEADEVIITDVYGAGEKEKKGACPLLFSEKMGKRCQYVPKEKLIEKVSLFIEPHDRVIFLGAGDITGVGKETFHQWGKREKKWQVALLFGGESIEHEISLRSARFFQKHLRKDLYDVHFFGLSKEGNWIEGGDALERLERGERGEEKILSEKVLAKLKQCEIALPIFHGPKGEDGMMAGFLETMKIPYAGPCVGSSSVAMNKVWTKQIASLHGVSTPNFIDFSKRDWQENSSLCLEEVSKAISFPVYVKAIHLGSSLGVYYVEKESELKSAIDNVFHHDNHVLIEEEVKGRAIEFAVLGNRWIEIAPPGEVLSEGVFYDFEKKYGEKALPTRVPALITEEEKIKGQELAKKVYKALHCQTMARVDFFLDQRGKYWLIEINPIPGFTEISLYPKMWEKGGLSFPELVDELIVLALHRKRSLAF